MTEEARGSDEATSPIVRRIGLALGPLLFLLLLSWSSGPLDVAQRQVAAITAWTATWWITAALPIGATSLLPAALFPLFGVMSGREVAPRYMHDLVFLFIGAFIISLGLERWNVHKRMALWLVSRVGTRPRSLVLGFMLASAFLSMWINNTSTTLLMLPIAVAVITSVTGKEPGLRDPFALALLLGVAYSASVGGMATPVGTVPNQVFLGQLTDRYPSAPAISFGQWTLAFLPLVLLYLPLAWLLLTRVVLRVPSTSLQGAEVIERERAQLGRMGRGERLMSAVFALTALAWMTRADLVLGPLTVPGWSRLLPDPKAISDATVATVIAVACFLIPVERGGAVRLMDWDTARRLPWDVLLLIGGGFAIAGAFQVSGLDQLIGSSLGPLLAGRSSWLMVAAIVLLLAALTEITSNTATTAVLLPVLGQAAVAADVSPLLLMVPATVAASAAFMLPVATPPNAVVFSSGRVPAPSMARVGLSVNLLMALLIVLVFQLWSARVLGVGEGPPAWATSETGGDQEEAQGLEDSSR